MTAPHLEIDTLDDLPHDGILYYRSGPPLSLLFVYETGRVVVVTFRDHPSTRETSNAV